MGAERRVIPADLDDRTLMFGLCNELCSENGFGWNLRLKTTHRMLNDPNASEMAKAISPVLARRYHYDAALVDSGREQQKAIVERLRDQLAAPRSEEHTSELQSLMRIS